MLPASLLNKLRNPLFFKLFITAICQGTSEHGGVIEKWMQLYFLYEISIYFS